MCSACVGKYMGFTPPTMTVPIRDPSSESPRQFSVPDQAFLLEGPSRYELQPSVHSVRSLRSDRTLPKCRYDTSSCILVYPTMLSPEDRSKLSSCLPTILNTSIKLCGKNRGKFLLYRKKS
ncbi:hypothetical protein YC2023_066108 [Brassica napus]